MIYSLLQKESFWRMFMKSMTLADIIDQLIEKNDFSGVISVKDKVQRLNVKSQLEKSF